MKRRFSTFYKIDFVRTFLCGISLPLAIASAANHWPSALVVTFAFLYLACLAWSVTKPLFSRERLLLLDWLEVAFHFAAIVALLVVDVINYKDFFSGSVIQIVCVIASGVFTLYGVAMTIKFNMWNEQDKERAKAKPHIFCVSDDAWNSLEAESIRTIEITRYTTSLKMVDKRKTHYSFDEIHLYNSDVSSCFLKGLFINEEQFLFFYYDEPLKKDSYNSFLVDCSFEAKTIITVHLIMEDALGNTYLCYTYPKTTKNKRTKSITISIKGIFSTTLRNDVNCNRIEEKYREKERKISKKLKKAELKKNF